jgi:predicted peptidase
MRQLPCTFSIPGPQPVRLDYLLYLPRDYKADPQARWPLILFLHGMGERGSDLQRLTQHGIPRVVEEREDFPFITVSPQCPEDTFWFRLVPALPALLDEVIATYRVDPERVYLTGLSMGGYGTWHLAVTCPHRFAALVPICGGLGPPEVAERVCLLKDVPVWAFHGALDPVVPVAESERAVEALRACGGQARLTVYPDAEHDAWTRTYDDPALYAWLLAQRRSAS